MHGILEQTVNGVKEDLAQWLDTGKVLDLDDQHRVQTRPHFVKPSSTLVVAALAKASARAIVPQRGAPSQTLEKTETKVKREGKPGQSAEPEEVLNLPPQGLKSYQGIGTRKRLSS